MANANDVGSIDAIIAAAYDSISGPANAKRDWDRMRSLFIPGARLIPTAKEAGRDDVVVIFAKTPDEGGFAAGERLDGNIGIVSETALTVKRTRPRSPQRIEDAETLQDRDYFLQNGQGFVWVQLGSSLRHWTGIRAETVPLPIGRDLVFCRSRMPVAIALRSQT